MKSRISTHSIRNFLIILPHIFAMGTLGFGYFLPLVIILQSIDTGSSIGIMVGIITAVWFLILPVLAVTGKADKMNLE